ncbi:MAG TPA: copper chaperone PCu(A)C [Gemmatimonadales bacterium]|nr:copper chaperone PCu(A)C [Gemmatimonadales bacterium]
MRRAVLAAGLVLTVASACRRAPDVGASATVGQVTVRRAVAWTMNEVQSATAGFELDVAQGTDTLLAVSSPAGRAGLHATQGPGGMHEIASLPLASGRTMVDGRTVHVMVQDLAADIPIGGTLPLELRFARAGTVELAVPVLRFSEALTALGR